MSATTTRTTTDSCSTWTLQWRRSEPGITLEAGFANLQGSHASRIFTKPGLLYNEVEPQIQAKLDNPPHQANRPVRIHRQSRHHTRGGTRTWRRKWASHRCYLTMYIRFSPSALDNKRTFRWESLTAESQRSTSKWPRYQLTHLKPILFTMPAKAYIGLSIFRTTLEHMNPYETLVA